MPSIPFSPCPAFRGPEHQNFPAQNPDPRVEIPEPRKSAAWPQRSSLGEQVVQLVDGRGGRGRADPAAFCGEPVGGGVCAEAKVQGGELLGARGHGGQGDGCQLARPWQRWRCGHHQGASVDCKP
eukprot:15157829-Alexandrium_andersonii.AAC.1